ncbi:MAG: M28 family metallopeptidase [Gaiellaceae bacterium]
MVLLPLAILGLSVTEPSPLPESALPASFNGQSAADVAETFSSLFPDRVPGTPAAQQAADWVAAQLATAGLTVNSVRFEASIPELGDRELVNVIGILPPRESGRSSKTIVVVAHRDNDGLSPGTNDNATGTAILLQIARQVGTTSLDHTLVFVSLDGGASGNAGALELARDGMTPESLFSPGRALAVVNLDSLGTPGAPRLLFGGDGGAFASPVLVATADARVVDATGSRARTLSPLLQLAQLAAPVTLTDEAPLVDSGVSALTITTHGDAPVQASDNGPGQLDLDSLSAAGSAAQQLVSTLDGSADVASGTDAYVYLGGRALRGWAIALTLLAGLLPVLASTVDLLARCRRRKLRIAPGLRSVRTRGLFVLWLAGSVYLLAAVGAIPGGFSNRPLPPDAPAATSWSLGALIGLAVLAVAGYAIVWRWLRRNREVEAGDALAGHAAAMIVLCLVALATALVNPFALIFVLPSLHAWLWLPHLRDRPALAQLVTFGLGFLGPGLFVASLAVRLGIGADAPWYALTLVAGGAISVPLVLLAAVWSACALQVGAILLGRYAPFPEPSDPGAERVGLMGRLLSARAPTPEAGS